jgi:hypothetical protein
MFLFTSEALDRLSREHVRKAITMFNRLLDAGIDIVTLADGRRYRADAVGFEAAIDIALSAFSFGTGNEESSKKSFRGTANWVEKRRQASDDKTPMTSLTPGWLSLDKETMKFVPIGDRVETLVAIFERAAAGAGKRTIAREFAHLERWGHRTLYESYIGKLLVDRRVLGEFQPGTRPKGGRWSSAGGSDPGLLSTRHRRRSVVACASCARRPCRRRRQIRRVPVDLPRHDLLRRMFAEEPQAGRHGLRVERSQCEVRSGQIGLLARAAREVRSHDAVRLQPS